MGREAMVRAEVSGESGEVKALLESNELILRGGVRRRFAKTEMSDVHVDGEVLRFQAKGDVVALHLGSKMAAKWAAAIAKPPPSLRSKLGLGGDNRALLIGTLEDDALVEALEGALAEEPVHPQIIIATVHDASGLRNAQDAHSEFSALPLWVVYLKGPMVAFGDTAIRKALRNAGFRDTKSCAVSEKWTATRFHLKST